MGISGHPVHLASLKDSQVPYFSPSLTNPSSGFICLKIAQEKNHPSAILYSNQVKWKLCKETYPSVIPQLSSGWNLLHSASCPPPLPGSLWGDGWVGREARVSDGGDCLCSSISRRSKPSYYSARVGQSQSSIILGGGGCFHGTPGNLASHKHWQYRWNYTSTRRQDHRQRLSERARIYFIVLKNKFHGRKLYVQRDICMDCRGSVILCYHVLRMPKKMTPGRKKKKTACGISPLFGYSTTSGNTQWITSGNGCETTWDKHH